MGWSLGLHGSVSNSVLVDAFLLAAGKALYFASEFENKCTYFLRIANLGDSIKADPVLSLTDAIAALPPDKKNLGGTLAELSRKVPWQGESFAVVDKARPARNLIAHEVASLGPLGLVQKAGISERLARLRAAVSDLAAGDNIVSMWIYAIEERGEPTPHRLIELYPELVERCVFGHLDAAQWAELVMPEESQVSLADRAHAWYAARQQGGTRTTDT